MNDDIWKAAEAARERHQMLDALAKAAMNGLLTAGWLRAKDVAGPAYEVAEAMLNERERRLNAAAPPELPSAATLTFDDAIAMAKGCFDYSGGHHTDGHLEAYHHGIQTVVNVLVAAGHQGLDDMQVRAVYASGKQHKEDK